LPRRLKRSVEIIAWDSLRFAQNVTNQRIRLLPAVMKQGVARHAQKQRVASEYVYFAASSALRRSQDRAAVIQEKVLARVSGLRSVADAGYSAISDLRRVTQNWAVFQQKIFAL